MGFFKEFREDCSQAVNELLSDKPDSPDSDSLEPGSEEPEKEETLTSSLEEMMLDKESAFLIHQALHNLPEPYKEVFSLRVLGELSFQQIGLLFGKTENWARVTYHRARLRIKEELK